MARFVTFTGAETKAELVELIHHLRQRRDRVALRSVALELDDDINEALDAWSAAPDWAPPAPRQSPDGQAAASHP